MVAPLADTRRRQWPVQLRARRDLGPGNLPSEVNGFVGREAALVRLRELQAETRLLTLVGPGGVGKTRLALRLEAELSDAFPDGTWLVDLSPIADSALVPQAIGDVLGVHQPFGQSWMLELTRVLRPHRLLLVLDNCEHLVTACAELADDLLRACPNLCLIATSLQPLGIAAETTWRVPPLVVPPAAAIDVQAVRDSEAVRLFVARVRSRLSDFAVDEHNARVVAEICRRLDGLPLALELVAARVESLGVAEVATRLSDRFALAIGNGRTAPSRQRTLHAALDWSYGLLDPDERALLRGLAVFVGGWTLEAAEAVCRDEALSHDNVVDVLGRLVTKSLVVAEHAAVSVRYRLLETVRAYALDQRARAGETAALRHRHADFMLGVAERALPEAIDANHVALLIPEEDNVRAALDWALHQGQAELGLRLATAAFPMWAYLGHYAEGSSWLDRLLGHPAAATATAAAHSRALTFDAQLWLMQGDYDLAETMGHAALEEQRTRGDVRAIAVTLVVLGDAALQRGDLAQAAPLFADATRRLHELRSPAEVICLLQFGEAAGAAGDFDLLRRLLGEIEALDTSGRRAFVVARTLHLKALLAARDGLAVVAANLLERAVELCRSADNQHGTVMSLTSLGHVRLDQGQTSAALEAFGEAVARARVSGERVRLIRALEGVARGLVSYDAHAAVRLAAAADAGRQSLGAAMWPTERQVLEAWLAEAQRELGQTAYQRAREDGHASTLDQALSLAEVLTVEPQAVATPDEILSPREQEVAILLARGLTNKQVALELVVSPATVRSHVEHILAKLDLRSRAQIAVWVSMQGLLSAEPPRPPDYTP